MPKPSIILVANAALNTLDVVAGKEAAGKLASVSRATVTTKISDGKLLKKSWIFFAWEESLQTIQQQARGFCDCGDNLFVIRVHLKNKQIRELIQDSGFGAWLANNLTDASLKGMLCHILLRRAIGDVPTEGDDVPPFGRDSAGGDPEVHRGAGAGRNVTGRPRRDVAVDDVAGRGARYVTAGQPDAERHAIWREGFFKNTMIAILTMAFILISLQTDIQSLTKRAETIVFSISGVDLEPLPITPARPNHFVASYEDTDGDLNCNNGCDNPYFQKEDNDGEENEIGDDGDLYCVGDDLSRAANSTLRAKYEDLEKAHASAIWEKNHIIEGKDKAINVHANVIQQKDQALAKLQAGVDAIEAERVRAIQQKDEDATSKVACTSVIQQKDQALAKLKADVDAIEAERVRAIQQKDEDASRLNADIGTINAEHASVIQQKNKALAKLKVDVGTIKTEHAGVIQQKDQALAKLNANIDDIEAEHASVIQQKDQALAELKSYVDIIVAEYASSTQRKDDDIARLKADHVNAISEKDQVITMLEADIDTFEAGNISVVQQKDRSVSWFQCALVTIAVAAFLYWTWNKETSTKSLSRDAKCHMIETMEGTDAVIASLRQDVKCQRFIVKEKVAIIRSVGDNLRALRGVCERTIARLVREIIHLRSENKQVRASADGEGPQLLQHLLSPDE